MDYYTILAFVIGVVIVGAIAIIKNYRLTKADKTASKIVTIIRKALDEHSKEIKAYDKENGTKYYQSLSDSLKEVEAMVADDNISPLEFALNVVAMYEDIQSILENVNIYDKVVTEPVE